MNLQELTMRLQTLCHDGYSQNEILSIDKNEIILESSVTKDGVIKVKMK